MEHVGLTWAELIDTAKWWCFAVFEINLQIIRTMRREFVSKSFREDVGKIVVLIWNIELLKFFGSWNLGIAARELVAAARSCKENWTALGSLIARRKATALIRAMSIGGGDGSEESERSAGEVGDMP